jgi:SecD/SecF fusion protein
VDSSKIPQAADMFGLTDEQEIEKFRVENPLMGKFNLEVGMNPDRSYIAYAALEDTAGINRILGPARKMGLFGDFDFLWMSKTQPMMEDNVPLLPLIAIRNTSDGQPLLGGEYIVNARADFTVDSGEPMISISMNSEGSQIWSRLTRNEIGREIAITLDGNVLTAPRVQQEITGGRSQITGSFTPVEAGDLAAILRAGALPTPLRIVNEEVIAPSTHD